MLPEASELGGDFVSKQWNAGLKQLVRSTAKVLVRWSSEGLGGAVAAVHRADNGCGDGIRKRCTRGHADHPQTWGCSHARMTSCQTVSAPGVPQQSFRV